LGWYSEKKEWSDITFIVVLAGKIEEKVPPGWILSLAGNVAMDKITGGWERACPDICFQILLSRAPG